MISRCALSLYLAVALTIYSGCNYVTDLQQAAPVVQPAAPPPTVAVEPVPVDPVVPTPEPPAPPKQDPAVLAKWQAGHVELLQVLKTIDDVAYGRRGNLNEQQVKEIFADCKQRMTVVAESVPELTTAAESAGNIFLYANPHVANIGIEKRLEGYTICVRAMQEQLNLAKPPQPQE